MNITVDYQTLPQLDTLLPPSPPGTPLLLAADLSHTPVSAISISSRVGLPFSPRDSTCRPTEPLQCFESTSSSPQLSAQAILSQRSPSLSRRLSGLPYSPKDGGCPRPQPRQPYRKIPMPEDGETTCPYMVPSRTSSLNRASVRSSSVASSIASSSSSSPSRGVGKPRSQNVRKQRRQQERRASISSSISSLSSRSSSCAASSPSLHRSITAQRRRHSGALQATLLTPSQAQLISIPPPPPSVSRPASINNALMTLNTSVPFTLSAGNTPLTAVSAVPSAPYQPLHPHFDRDAQPEQAKSPYLMDASPGELFPLLRFSSASASSSSLSTPSTSASSHGSSHTCSSVPLTEDAPLTTRYLPQASGKLTGLNVDFGGYELSQIDHGLDDSFSEFFPVLTSTTSFPQVVSLRHERRPIRRRRNLGVGLGLRDEIAVVVSPATTDSPDHQTHFTAARHSPLRMNSPQIENRQLLYPPTVSTASTPQAAPAEVDFDAFFFDLGCGAPSPGFPSEGFQRNSRNIHHRQPPMDLDTKLMSFSANNTPIIPATYVEETFMPGATFTTSPAALSAHEDCGDDGDDGDDEQEDEGIETDESSVNSLSRVPSKLDIPKAVDYNNGFVSTTQGGTGQRLDTGRLMGRVLRPWN